MAACTVALLPLVFFATFTVSSESLARPGGIDWKEFLFLSRSLGTAELALTLPCDSPFCQTNH